MYFLQSKRLKSFLWLLIVGSWVFGVLFYRWIGRYDLIFEIGAAVSIFNPLNFGAWWEIIAYFTLSTVSVFIFSHILFGAGGAIFMFARGMHDGLLIGYVEGTIGGWSISSINMSEVATVLIVLIVLSVNLPLCLWAGQLGSQRSVYALYRLRNKPVRPGFGSEPITNLLIIVAASLLFGLIAALLFTRL